MELKFNCCNHKCQKNGQRPYEVVIRSEAVMDEKNLAAMFCPHCRKPLKKCK